MITEAKHLSRAKMIGFLGELASHRDAGSSVFISAGVASAEAENLLAKAFPAETLPPEIIQPALNSKTGACLFGTLAQGYLVLPPFPLPAESYIAQGGEVERLRALLQRDFRVALVLVRLGAYAVGLCQGESLIRSKVGTGLVHGRHRQGGSSAARFRRHREKQIEYFMTRVCGHIREKLEPEARAMDYLVYGGAWTTVLLLQKACPFLSRLEVPTLPPLLDIAEPNQAVLEKAVGRIWSSTVIEWRQASEVANET